MVVSLDLKKGEKLYNKLKVQAQRDSDAACQLELLHETLKIHRILDDPQRDVCAEAILRLLLLEEMADQLLFDLKDGKMMALWGLVQHYQNLLDCNGQKLNLPI